MNKIKARFELKGLIMSIKQRKATDSQSIARHKARVMAAVVAYHKGRAGRSIGNGATTATRTGRMADVRLRRQAGPGGSRGITPTPIPASVNTTIKYNIFLAEKKGML